MPGEQKQVLCPQCKESVSLNNLGKHFKKHPEIIKEAENLKMNVNEFIYNKFYKKSEREGKCEKCNEETEFLTLSKGYHKLCISHRREIRKEAEKYICPICKDVLDPFHLLHHCNLKHPEIVKEAEERNIIVRRAIYDKYQKKPGEDECLICGSKTNWFQHTGYVRLCPECSKTRMTNETLVKVWTEKLGSEKLAKEKLREIRNGQSEKQSKEYILENFGEEELKRRKSHTNLEAFVSRYGEENGKIKYDEHCDKARSRINEEHWIKKLGEVKGKRFWNQLKSRFAINWFSIYKNRFPDMTDEEIKNQISKDMNHVSLKSFIERYGEKLGKERHNEYCKKLLGTKWKIENSVNARKFHKMILDRLDSKEVYLLFQENEMFLTSQSGENTFFYDISIPELKIIIEFNDQNMHADPRLYRENDYIKVFDKTAKEIWEYDKKKIQLAKENGYEVLIVWEKDFLNDPDEEISKILSKISEKSEMTSLRK